MNDYAIFLTHRVDCIAGKPPPTKKVSIQQITCCLIRGGLPAMASLTHQTDAASGLCATNRIIHSATVTPWWS
ncbi:hypothetical protein AB7M18_001724 [Pseudomonas viridiflava]